MNLAWVRPMLQCNAILLSSEQYPLTAVALPPGHVCGVWVADHTNA